MVLLITVQLVSVLFFQAMERNLPSRRLRVTGYGKLPGIRGVDDEITDLMLFCLIRASDCCLHKLVIVRRI